MCCILLSVKLKPAARPSGFFQIMVRLSGQPPTPAAQTCFVCDPDNMDSADVKCRRCIKKEIEEKQRLQQAKRRMEKELQRRQRWQATKNGSKKLRVEVAESRFRFVAVQKDLMRRLGLPYPR